jgi:hypothetical protein
VIESYLPCRLPVYRNLSAYTAVKKMRSFNSAYFDQPPVCTSAEDYAALRDAASELLSGNALAVKIEDVAKEQCPQLCTKLGYTVQFGVPAVNEKPQKEAFYFDFAHSCSWEVIMTTDTVKVTTQFYAYDVGNLIGELGGSWGLFLGFSLITLFDLVEQLMAKLVHLSSKF